MTSAEKVASVRRLIERDLAYLAAWMLAQEWQRSSEGPVRIGRQHYARGGA